MPSMGSSVQNVVGRLAAAAIDQAANFFGRGVGNCRADEVGDLIEDRDAFFEAQGVGLFFADEC